MSTREDARRACRRSLARQRGLSFIELVIFIVVVGVALAAVMTAINRGIQSSADPMIRKQALAAAESLLEEIELQPFTFCDPRDPNVTTATSSAGCSSASFSMDSTGNWGAGKSRYGPPPAGTDFYNNVGDYNGFTMTGTLNDIFKQASSNLTGYNATVTVTQVGGSFSLTPADVLQINVTVTGSGNSITLTGFRFRHSPNLAD
jgi:MSHA pilin protein MshD